MPVCLPACLPACMPASLHACLPACFPAYLPVSVPASLPTSLPASLPTSLPASLHVSLPTLPACLPACLPVCLPASLSHNLPTRLPASLPACLPTCPTAADFSVIKINKREREGNISHYFYIQLPIYTNSTSSQSQLARASRTALFSSRVYRSGPSRAINSHTTLPGYVISNSDPDSMPPSIPEESDGNEEKQVEDISLKEQLQPMMMSSSCVEDDEAAL
ncbi:UNVERIFIED_CONTAM: hypothetical protein FKN15_049561 [Acipenser sinensis]